MIGLGTYAFFWQHSSRVGHPLDLPDMLRRTREAGVDLFQICDYAPLDEMTDAQATSVAALARDLGITLELGTKGIEPDRIERYLHLADLLDVHLLRSMLFSATDRPTLEEAEQRLRAVSPALSAAGVTLALETYEQVSSRDLVSLIEAVADEHIGICLDPANTVAGLEHPLHVIERTAPYVKNIHVKDFAFTRRDGWVGFTLEGAPLGTGLLDYDRMRDIVRPDERDISQIIEHWLPLQDSVDATVQLENEWTTTALDYLRSRT